MKILNKFITFALLLFTASRPVLCTAAGPTLFVSIAPTLVFVTPGINQEINLINDLGNTYLDTTKGIYKSTLSLGVGMRSYQGEDLKVHTSVRYIPVSSLRLQGQIWQLKSPLFNDLAYNFHVKSNLLLVDNIITWTRHRFQPGVILGLGLSRNTTGRFSEIPLTDSAAPSLLETNGTSVTHMAYELGVALDYSLNSSVIELAYRYIDAGSGHLQPFTLQDSLDQMSTGRLNYHVFSIGIRAYYEL